MTLEVVDLRKTYPTGDEALKGVDLTVAGSETVAMVGPSGAGKSTFIRCINRLTEPSGGEVRLDGTDLVGLDDEGLRAARRDIGMIFQEYNLVERLTVMENVLTGRLGYVSTWRAFRTQLPARGHRAGVRAPRAGRARGHGEQAGRRAVRRPAAARRHRAGGHSGPDDPARRRADVESRSRDLARAVMSLLTDVAAERDIPVLINIYEVELALDHADRVVGLHDGELVFEGTPAEFDERARDTVYRGADASASDSVGRPERSGTDGSAVGETTRTPAGGS